MLRRWSIPLLLLMAAPAVMPSPALATYSVVGVDQTNRWVGGAGTSCVGQLSVSIILGTAPGIGAVHAQAALNERGRDEAVSVLTGGGSPDEAIAAITNAGFDPQASARQYGVVDLEGRSAAYTGGQNMPWAGDHQGMHEDMHYSVQGNILTSEAVITQAVAGFERSDACDFPERLLRALEAGAENGEGDSRCTPRGIPADSAFIRVVDDQGQDVIFLDVKGSGNSDPLAALRTQFDAWRADHPCPDDDDTTESATDSGDTSETGSETGTESGSEDTEGGTGDDSGDDTDDNSGESGDHETGDESESEDGGSDDDDGSGEASESGDDGASGDEADNSGGDGDDDADEGGDERGEADGDSSASNGGCMLSAATGRSGFAITALLLSVTGLTRVRRTKPLSSR